MVTQTIADSERFSIDFSFYKQRRVNFVFQNHCIPFNSLAVLHKNSLKIESFIYFDSRNAALLRIKKAQLTINILILYRNNNSAVANFLVNLRQIIAVHNIHIVLGDFNINFLDFSHSSTSTLLDLMESFNFKQTVPAATFVPAGTLIDHVYINMAYVSLHHITTVVKSVYYSDHDAVKLCIPLDALFSIDEYQIPFLLFNKTSLFKIIKLTLQLT